jgi:hypothetical protein
MHHRGRRHHVHFAPQQRLTGLEVLHEFQDFWIVRYGAAAVTDGAGRNRGQTGLRLALNALMATYTADVVLSVRPMIERDRLRWWWRRVVGAAGQKCRRNGEPEAAESRSYSGGVDSRA